ncbi:MAG: hypothetical protein QGF09_06615 [Rhodospirillales bacterium]|nr:hypothetical protein [Rhodospirillales bacterium]
MMDSALIGRSIDEFDTPMMTERMFVGIIVITILGVLTNLVLRELERLAVPWRNDP